MPTPEERIQAIEDRNRRVEADKGWETSWFRRILLSVAIYITAVLFLWSSNADAYWLQSLVPAGAFLLSTLSLPWVKKRWVYREQVRHRRTSRMVKKQGK
tara:strand:+ start:311 stop:610 length:300 start_codon:yes stop_codon:yes gene_type:complete